LYTYTLLLHVVVKNMYTGFLELER